ncbi:hypothetical protein KOM00_06410 [Geomonas sp. Red69]|uniref:hypothetical protein n=1 Tax=Geomonas diazotrophica TaxID=2843197 RepID=UPI001C12568E|nr:hypothetical protein [Geomonas diazotrophica]MBU5636364.1 hypothetical protein [Geomonas diazotrophica]
MANLDLGPTHLRKHHYRLSARTAALMVACSLLSGCMCLLKNPPDSGVKFYQQLGSVQCTGGGKTVAEVKRDILTAGITVTQTSCGVDGRMYPAVCGAPDGRIAIFEIAPDQARAALAIGLKPLTELPDATATPCPER